MNPKLSVIVPVYNTLPYLQTCFDSIKRQEYEPMEVILVDDGSPDGAGEFCDKYAKTDRRFRVIHKKNGGISSARNAGIDAATGELVTFIDSDDALIGQPYSNLINIMLENHAQIIGMDRFYSESSPHEIEQVDKKIEIRKLDNNQFYIELCNQTVSEAVWDKIFVKSIFENHRFTEGVLNEDFLLLIQFAQKLFNITITNYIGYYYYKRTGGITGSGFKKNMVDALHNADFAYANAPSEACKKAAEGYLLHKILMFMINMPNSFVKDKNPEYLYAKDRLKELNILESNRSMRDKLLLCSFKVAPGFANRLCSSYLSRGMKKA